MGHKTATNSNAKLKKQDTSPKSDNAEEGIKVTLGSLMSKEMCANYERNANILSNLMQSLDCKILIKYSNLENLQLLGCTTTFRISVSSSPAAFASNSCVQAARTGCPEVTWTLEKGSMTLMRFCSSRLSYSLVRWVLMMGSSRSSALYSVKA